MGHYKLMHKHIVLLYDVSRVEQNEKRVHSSSGCGSNKERKFMSSNSIDQTKPLCLKTSSIAVPIFAGDSTTVTPASLRVLILSCAVPLPPDTIAAFNENLVSLQHAYVMIVKLKKEHNQNK